MNCCYTTSSYPQGHLSFLPQVLAVAALIASFSAFAIGHADRYTIDSWFYFLCIQFKIRGSSYSSSYTYHDECYALELTSPYFWEEDEEDYNWAWPIQLAAVIAIFIFIAGSLATMVLLSATCFELPPKTLTRLAIVYLFCAPWSLFTLIAGAVDVCKKVNREFADMECERVGAGTRLQAGGTMMIFAAFFYVLAAISVFSYRNAIVGRDNAEEEEEVFLPKEEMVPLQQQQQEQYPDNPMAQEKDLEAPTITHRTVNPDGSKTDTAVSSNSTTPVDGSPPPTSNPTKKRRHSHKKLSPAQKPHTTNM